MFAVVRIGSDEDDEGDDESLSAEDPSETAVSRDAKKEQCDGAAAAAALNGEVGRLLQVHNSWLYSVPPVSAAFSPGVCVFRHCACS